MGHPARHDRAPRRDPAQPRERPLLSARGATLPLGIDIGTTRTRVALLACEAGRDPRLIAVATRPTGSDPARAIADAHAELGTRERRCILAVGAPAASLRAVALPDMTRRERARAARFEAAPSPLEPASVRVQMLDRSRCVLGVAPQRVLDERVVAARRARLRPLAVDDAAFALLRAFPAGGALVDVGEGTTRLIVPGDPLPSIRAFATGGRDFTAAIAGALGIDTAAAERRKRSIGLGGAGEHARDDLVAALGAALLAIRAEARCEVRAIGLTGNGARLQGLAEALERAAAIPVRIATLPTAASQALPADVVRAAAPDWGLAYGLALWPLKA